MSDTKISTKPFIFSTVSSFQSFYQPPGISFNGTTSWLDRGGVMTGVTDTKVGLVSFWFWVKGSDGSPLGILAFNDFALGATVSMSRHFAGSMIAFLANTSGATILSMLTPSTYTSSMTGWAHFAVWYDLSVGAGDIYINGVAQATGPPSVAALNINQSAVGGEWTIGSEASAFGVPFRFYNGYLAQVYFNTQQTLDLSSPANIQKLITSTGHPVDLGADGSSVTGTQPALYLNNPAATFGTNRGSGGNYTATAITNVAGPV